MAAIIEAREALGRGDKPADTVELDEKGCVEDRRPDANMDAHVVTRLMVNACCRTPADAGFV